MQLPDQGGTVRRLTISAGQVATKLGCSVPTFHKHRPALEAAGFPKKLPGFNAWSEPAVDAWFAQAGLPASPEPAPAATPSGELERRYA